MILKELQESIVFMKIFKYFSNVKTPKAAADPLIGFFVFVEIAPGVQSSNTCSVSFGALTARHFLFVKNPKGVPMKHLSFLLFNALLLLLITGVYLFSIGQLTGSIIVFSGVSIATGILIGYRIRCIKKDKTIHNQGLKIHEQLEKIEDLRQAVQ